MKDGLGFKRETTFQDEQAAHPQNSVSPDRATSRERGGRLVRVPNLYFGSTIQLGNLTSGREIFLNN